MSEPVFPSSNGYAAIFAVASAAVLVSIPLTRKLNDQHAEDRARSAR